MERRLVCVEIRIFLPFIELNVIKKGKPIKNLKKCVASFYSMRDLQSVGQRMKEVMKMTTNGVR